MDKNKLEQCHRCCHFLVIGSPYPELRMYKDEEVYYEHDFCGFLTKGAKTEDEARKNWNDKNFCKEFFDNLYSWEKSIGKGFKSPLKTTGDDIK